MRFEIVIIVVTVFLIYNTYHDGKYTAMIYKNKKNIQIAFYAIVGISLFLLMRKSPAKGRQLLFHANEAVKYMPLDKQSARILSPILDFTVRDSNDFTFMGYMNSNNQQSSQCLEKRILSSGKTSTGGAGKATKRSVSETKKKYVASRQNWRCQDCSEQLTAWFEVHHKTPLEHGGSNHIDNLVALCRNCHGAHTALDNL